ncbi:hypothetical protein P7K49_023150 [Saguinus oedipus]|uniref:Epithelial sodium channel subunit gamma n=3 Tax=Simiiformes TaxID=314293 RepID=A0ABQ9UKV1_SAGOE|nr:hypothetical protein P7K49_023150 [Saguinus oedipus]
MAPGEKIKAKIKKNLPVTGPQAPTIKELMQWYCLNTNTHGCRRIVVSRGRLRRLLWIGFTLTAVALILWQCALLVFSFYTVSVSIKVHFRKLDFPAVTICNINPYNPNHPVPIRIHAPGSPGSHAPSRCSMSELKADSEVTPSTDLRTISGQRQSELGGEGACPSGRLLVGSYLFVLAVAGLWEAPDSHHSRNAGQDKLINTPKSEQRVVAEVKPQEATHGSPMSLSPFAGARGHFGRGKPYSAVSHLLADLEQETKEALTSLYGFPESRKRREAESWSSVLEGAQPRFSRRIPLLLFDQDEKGKARDFFTGRKRKVSGSIIHKASNVMHIESKQVVGFQLCSNDTSDCATYTFSSGINAIQEWYKLHYMNIMAQVPLEKKINMSYSAEELLVTCFFDGVSCNARNFTLFHHPMHGNCYTFNNRENETILSTSMGGSEYAKTERGLQVILYINEQEYNPFLVSSTGAKVIIHRQDEYPFVEDVGTEIETAMVTSIGMHLVCTSSRKKPSTRSIPTLAISAVPSLAEAAVYSKKQGQSMKTKGKKGPHTHPESDLGYQQASCHFGLLTGAARLLRHALSSWERKSFLLLGESAGNLSEKVTWDYWLGQELPLKCENNGLIATLSGNSLAGLTISQMRSDYTGWKVSRLQEGQVEPVTDTLDAENSSTGPGGTESFKLSEPYSQCTEDGSDVPIRNIYNAAYSLQERRGLGETLAKGSRVWLPSLLVPLHSRMALGQLGSPQQPEGETKMVEKCGCAQYSQPLPPEANYCNYQQHPNWSEWDQPQPCMPQDQVYCYYQLHQAFVQEELGCQSVCKEACSFKEWTLTTSLAQWPSVVSEKWLLPVLTWDQGQQVNKKLNKTDLAKLLIFYKDLNQRSIMESPANSVSSVASFQDLSWVYRCAHLPGLGEQSQGRGFQSAVGGLLRPARSQVRMRRVRRDRKPACFFPRACAGSGLARGSLVNRGPCVRPTWEKVPLDGVAWPSLQIEMLLSNFGGQLGLWMSCSVVCVIEIIEVFFIDFFSIIARRQWQKAKEWWARKQAPCCPEAPRSPQGQDNPALDIDDDLPTFNSALHLPPALGTQVPGTPPPKYNTLRLERAFSNQLTDTQMLDEL